MQNDKLVLDATCGGRMMWYQKSNPHTLYVDERRFSEKMSNGQNFKVEPDQIVDYRNMPFDDESFHLVVFDPPHFFSQKPTGWLAKKYGILDKENWKTDLQLGFSECWRVLKNNGTLVVKWSVEKGSKSRSIPIQDVIKVFGRQPLFGTRPGSHNNTYWLIFMKIGGNDERG